jgi:aminodeoxychorismate lyase
MIVFLNGEFVPEDRALISVFDRSFLYGDGLFETMRVLNGRPFRWNEHLERLQSGAKFLRIKLPFTPKALEGFATKLIQDNRMPDCLLRLTLSRGVGVRGYSPKGAENPSLVMTLHPTPPLDAMHPLAWRLSTASFRLPANEVLAQFKTCNKLAQVLARAEAEEAGSDEAVLLNTDGFVVEGATSNLFWVQGNTVFTPALAAGILAGVTRLVVLEICEKLNVEVREAAITPGQLGQADGVFLSNSAVGLIRGVSLDGKPLAQSNLVEKLGTAYDDLLIREAARPGFADEP